LIISQKVDMQKLSNSKVVAGSVDIV